MLRRGRDEAGRRGGGLFPVAPDGEVAKAEGVPPERKHGTVEVQNTLACDAFGSGEQMPEREGVALARLGKNGGESDASRFGSLRVEIELRNGLAERFTGVLEVRSAGAGLWAHGTHRRGGDERVAVVELETDPAKRRAKRAGTIGSNCEGVSAAKVQGHGGGRVHNELTGGSPNGGANGADVELNAFVFFIGLQEAHTGIGLDVHAAEIFFGNGSARSGVCFEGLANVQLCAAMFRGDQVRADLRSALETRDIPAGAQWRIRGRKKHGNHACGEGHENDGNGGETRNPKHLLEEGAEFAGLRE